MTAVKKKNLIWAIAGTDTDVGKTVVSSALLAYWQKYSSDRRCGIFKPIQSGEGDRQWYEDKFGSSVRVVNPLQYTEPLAPPIAAALAGETIDLGLVWREFVELTAVAEAIVVEGIGGLGTPVTAELTCADLFAAWRLPTILVVPVKLGSISQAIASVSLAREKGVDLRGFILCCTTAAGEKEIDRLTPPATIVSFTNIPYCGCIPYLADIGDRDSLAKAASELDLPSPP
jgi:dethiobiotin synthetase